MPPKKRARNATSTTVQAEQAKAHVSHPDKNSNTQGFPALPVELSLEIISYFPSVGIPARTLGHVPVLSRAYLERPQVLRALSQTCRALRNIFLPLLWERLEACAIPQVAEDMQSNAHVGSWYKSVGEALERKSEALVRDTELASYVRIVNVVLTRYSTATVLTAFARCLSVLPNVHTVQILHAHSKMTSAIKTAFEGLQFPSVRVVILPSCAHELLRCCPNVREVACCAEDGSKLVTAISKACKSVETLEGFFVDEKMMKRILKATPNLRTIKFDRYQFSPMNLDTLNLLSGLKKLNTIELWSPGGKYATEFKAMISAAKAALSKQAGVAGKKYLRVRYPIVGPGTYGPPEEILIN